MLGLKILYAGLRPFRMTRSRVLRNVSVASITIFFSLYFLTETSKDWLTSAYYDHRGYLMSRSEELQFNLQEIAKTIRIPHELNLAGLAAFRKELFSFVDPESIVITKKNIAVDDEVAIYFDNSVTITVDEEFYKLLPDEVPFKKTYASCSLVGSSGILAGSGCGKQIDSSEFVMRMNVPPLEEYSADVGVKANLTTMNPSIVGRRYYHLLRKSDQEKFLEEMKEFKTYIYLPPFSTPKGFGICVNAAKTFSNTNGYPIKPLFIHPAHFLAASDHWKSRGITAERISSGLYMISVAVSLCDKVDLYGFWPFHYDHNNKKVDYHYYGQGFVPLPMVHKFAEEFGSVLELHKQGLLTMHVGTCDAPPNAR